MRREDKGGELPSVSVSAWGLVLYVGDRGVAVSRSEELASDALTILHKDREGIVVGLTVLWPSEMSLDLWSAHRRCSGT